MSRLRMKWFSFGLLLIMAASSVSAMAQVNATISGRVEDASGAAVPAATVTATSLETGATRAATTDETGRYRLLSLPVGRYSIKAEKAGFKEVIQTGINLVVGQEAVVNLKLEVGEVQQQVTVTGEAPVVNTTTSSVSGLVGEQQVKDLPLNGRSFDNLITLNPGTNSATTGLAGRTAFGSGPPGAQFNISGGRNSDNFFMLNGIEYTGSALIGTTPGGASGQLLGIDAVREFNVLTNTYGAEYGKRSGGQISVVTTSGTNQFHGTAFEFLRNSFFDAPNFFTNAANHTIPPFRRNDFGAAAGGPIRKDKTFIFGNYEGYRQSLSNTNVSFVPDAAARQGFLPTGPGGSLVNVGVAPGMAQYFSIYPAPNGPELGGGIAQAFAEAAYPVREDFGTVRADQVISEKDLLFGVYTIDDSYSSSPFQDPLSGTITNLREQVASLEETHTFSPTVINTARIGFSRAGSNVDSGPLVPFPSSMSLVAGKPLGSITIGGGGGSSAGLGVSTFGSVSVERIFYRNLFTYTDSVQIVKGKHLITLGGWSQRQRLNGLNGASNAYGSVSFGSLASFLQGQATSFSAALAVNPVSWRQWEGAWFVQDNIKVTQNLNLTLGLRHEFTDGWNFNKPIPAYYPFGQYGCAPGVAACISATPVVGTQAFVPNNAKWLFGPRIGLAWSPFGSGKTSVRAGYGTYYNLIDDITYEQPQGPSVGLVNPKFPMQVAVPPGPPNLLGFSPSPFFENPDAKTPTLQQWSLTVEQQLSPTTVLSVGYVGSHGYHYVVQTNMNLRVPTICSSSLGNCPAGYPNGIEYFSTSAPLMNPALIGSAAFPYYGASSYNALQVDVRQRLTKGLTFRANYTWSKNMDLQSNGPGTLYIPGCPNVIDFRTIKYDWGPSCFNTTHRFSTSGSYELPIGKGKAFLGGLSGVADKVLGGWKLNGIFTAQSGMPFTPLAGVDIAHLTLSATSNSERPNANPAFSGSIISGSPNRWFNPNAFILPPPGTLGYVGRNVLGGPDLINLDMSLFKDTHISERLNLQFRAEVFNILNHANFALPSQAIFMSSGAQFGSAGVISSTITDPREIQLGLKLIW